MILRRDVVGPGGALMCKEAESADEELRLEHEAAVLRTASHPGVVELVGISADSFGRTILETRFVEGADLSRIGPLPVAEVAGLGAAVATTLADIHEIGVVHAALSPSHILVDRQGRPVLCGFGDARLSNRTEERSELRGSDVMALAGILLDQLSTDAPAGLVRMLRRNAQGRSRRAIAARQLARSLVDHVANARLPTLPTIEDEARPDRPDHEVAHLTPEDRTATPSAPLAVAPHAPILTPPPLEMPPSRELARSRRPVVPVKVVAAVLAVAVIGFVWSSHARSTAAGAGRPCPVVDHGCGPLPLVDGVLVAAGGHFHIGEPGDVVVLGRWECTDIGLPALLRPSTGDVWIFDRWAASGDDVPGRRVGQVVGAQSLRVLSSPSGCDRVSVRRRGPAIELDPRKP